MVEKPELFNLLPGRTEGDRKLCLVWDRSAKGTYSWSFFKSKECYVLRRLHSTQERGVLAKNLTVYGMERPVSRAFYDSVRSSLQEIGCLQNETAWIDSQSFRVTIDGICTIDYTYSEESPEIVLLMAMAARMNGAGLGGGQA